MPVQLRRLICLTGVLAVVPATGVGAEIPLLSAADGLTSTQASELQLAQAVVEITNIQVETDAAGLRLVLETNGTLAEPITSTIGNALLLEFADAALALPDGTASEVINPVAGVALISLTELGDNSVRIAITGSEGVPTAQVSTTATAATLTIEPGMAQAGTEEDLLRIAVTGEADDDYNPSSAATATGLDTPLRDIPQSIQVIPEAVIEDRNAVELGDTLETAGSVVSRGGRGTSVFGPGFSIRGFPVEDGVFRDGIETSSLAPLETNDIERVEILKGPASILFGQGDPGGIINLVSEQPLGEPRYEIAATVGNYSTYRGDVDLTGPLTSDRSVRYRLNLSAESFGSFRDFVDGEGVFISPAIAWDIGPNTSLNIYGQYAYNRETIDDGIPFTADGPVDVPRSRFIGEDFGEFSQDQFTIGYRLNHDFNDSFGLRHSLQYLQYSPERYAPIYNFFDETTGDIERLAYFAGGQYERFFTNLEAVGRFNTGSIEHQILAGIEYRNVLEQPEFQFSDLYTTINVFDPVYTGTPYPIAPEFFRDDTIRTVGVYFQDQIELLPNLKVLAGLRYDSVDQFRTTQNIGEAREEFSQVDGALSPRVGIVYQPVEPLSLYASYTESFEPSFGASRNGDGSTFEPETGRQYEIGAKADLTDQLSLTFAAFDIRRQNVVVQDPDNPLLSIQTGEVASRGLELSLGGEITPGWNISAAYTLLDAFVSEDTTDVEGNQLANVPDNQFSLWTTYEIQSGGLQGLGFGLGFFYLSDRPGTLDNSFTLPSYFRTDAALFYERDNWRAQVNFENLFDIEYFTSSDEFQFANPGAPFTVTAKVAVEF